MDRNRAQRQCLPTRVFAASVGPLGLLGEWPLPMVQHIFSYLEWQEQITVRVAASGFDRALGKFVKSLELRLPLRQPATAPAYEGPRVSSRALWVFNCLEDLTLTVWDEADTGLEEETATLIALLMSPSLLKLWVHARAWWACPPVLSNLPRCINLERFILCMPPVMEEEGVGGAGMTLAVNCSQLSRLKHIDLDHGVTDWQEGGPPLGLLSYWMRHPSHFASLENVMLESQHQDQPALAELGERLSTVGPKQLRVFWPFHSKPVTAADVEGAASFWQENGACIRGALAHTPNLENLNLTNRPLTAEALEGTLSVAAPERGGALEVLSGVLALDYGPLARAVRGGRLGALCELKVASIYGRNLLREEDDWEVSVPPRPGLGGVNASCSPDPVSELLGSLAAPGACPMLKQLHLDVMRFDLLLLRALWAAMMSQGGRLERVYLVARQRMPEDALVTFERERQSHDRACHSATMLIHQFLKSCSEVPDTQCGRVLVDAEVCGDYINTCWETQEPNAQGRACVTELVASGNDGNHRRLHLVY